MDFCGHLNGRLTIGPIGENYSNAAHLAVSPRVYSLLAQRTILSRNNIKQRRRFQPSKQATFASVHARQQRAHAQSPQLRTGC
jgi:hypothetical protein